MEDCHCGAVFPSFFTISLHLFTVIFLLLHAPYVGHYVITLCGLNSPQLMTSAPGPQRERHSFLLSCIFKQEIRVSASAERKVSPVTVQLFNLIHKLHLHVLTQRRRQLWMFTAVFLAIGKKHDVVSVFESSAM